VDRPDTVAIADTEYQLLDDNGRYPNASQLVTYCARRGRNGSGRAWRISLLNGSQIVRSEIGLVMGDSTTSPA
jgi:hypothetical protein